MRILILLIAAGLVGPVHAAMLQFSVIDDTGDFDEVQPALAAGGFGDTDFAGYHFAFNRATGDYEIRVFATPENPFDGFFVVNINVYNESLNGAYPAPPATSDFLFRDSQNVFDGVDSTTEIILTGTSLELTGWSAGDVLIVAGVSFSSGVVDTVRNGGPLELITGDYLARDPVRRATLVPLPAAGWFALSAVGLLGTVRRRRRQGLAPVQA